MTLAATRRYALALSAVIGLLAFVSAGALIGVILGHPERVVAITESDLSAILQLVVDGLASAARGLIHFLS